jgi:L-asparagine oxygenase
MKARVSPAQVRSCGLSVAERDRALSALEALAGPRTSSVDELIDHAFVAMVSALPAAVLTEIAGLRRSSSAGSLVIRNLPIDPVLVPTPSTVTPSLHDALPIARAALLGSVRILGEAFAYRAEYDGEIVGHVLPSKAGLDLVSSRGSRAVLPFHTEDVHLSPFSPDYVALMCLRPDPGRTARTSLVHGTDVVRMLPSDVQEILRLPLFRVRSPPSFGDGRMVSQPIPVLRGPGACPQVAVELSDMAGMTESAQQSIDALWAACQEVSVDVTLDAGDVLLIDNRRVLHGRTSFEPKFDGTDRWCIRVLVKAGDLWDWRLYLDGRRLVL